MMSNSNNNGGSPAPNRLEDTITMEWLMQQHNQQQEINARLMQGISAIQASLQTPSPSVEPVQPTIAGSVTEGGRRPKHSLAHPNTFDGQDRGAYPAFKGYLRVKFRIDSAAIGGETEKVWYGYGYLTGKAAERIFPWLAAKEERQEPLRVDDFFTQLDTAFSDPQRSQRALEWINSKKQGNRPFQEFLQEFEQNLLEAGGWEFSDAVRKGYLRSAVSRRIKEKLVAVEEPARYEDFVNQLRRTSDNLAELDRTGGQRGVWTKPQSDVHEPEQGSMDWEPTPKVASSSTRPRRAKWVSKEVLNQRRDKQECLRCGGSDHFVSRCRLAPALRPEAESKSSRGTIVAAVTGKEPPPRRKTKGEQKPVIEESSSESSTKSDSGNE